MTTTQPSMDERAPHAGLAMRPSQWVKIAHPGRARGCGHATHGTVLRQTIVAFLAFCLVSSGVDLLNDVQDREADRCHPTKRFRAIASGRLSTPVAVGTALVLFGFGFAVSLLIAHPGELVIVLALYVAIALSYVYWIKNVAIIELGAVASGFFLRAYGGAAASHIPVSTWFLVVISFGALFLSSANARAN